jgi:hypothetical protein
MNRPGIFNFAPAALILAAAAAQPAVAATKVVALNVLSATVTLPTPLLGGDSLILDTLVSPQTGALLQTINFLVGAGVTSLSGDAVWQISTAAGLGPRLIGVNLDVFNNTTNTLVVSDSNVIVAGAFAVSKFNATALTPGSYRLVATGTGVRDSVLDVTLNYAGVVPEPGTIGMMLAGLGAVGFMAARRRA